MDGCLLLPTKQPAQEGHLRSSIKPLTRLHGSSSMGNISYHDLRLEIGWSWLGKNSEVQN